MTLWVVELLGPPPLFDLVSKKHRMTGGNTVMNVGGPCVVKHGAMCDHAPVPEGTPFMGEKACGGVVAKKPASGHNSKDPRAGVEGIPGAAIKVAPKPALPL